MRYMAVTKCAYCKLCIEYYVMSNLNAFLFIGDLNPIEQYMMQVFEYADDVTMLECKWYIAYIIYIYACI